MMIRKRLLSGDIYFAINKQLALFAIDRRQFDDVKEIIEYLNEMDFILTKFSLSKDEDGKGRLTEDMNLALTRYQSVLNMLSSIDPLNPMYADYEAKRNNYSKSLKNAEKTTRTIERKRYISKKFLIAMRMTAAGLFVASFFVDNIAGMVCRGAAFWWCIFDLFIRKKN